MKKFYKIAGLTVEMDSFGKTVRQAEAYEIFSAVNVDIVIASRWKELKAAHPQIPEEVCEYVASGSNFAKQLMNFNGVVLHSSAVVVDGVAYLFTAPSGTGKSTHTALWLKEFGDRAFILNDDKPAIRLEDGKLFAYGTPWSGKTDQNVNRRVPIGGICILRRGEENVIERAYGKTAIAGIFSQMLRPKNEEYANKALFLLERIIALVPVWQMHCNMDPDAARVSYEAMSGALPKTH